MAKKIDHSRIEEVALDKALGERYLSYAMSTIMARSLPDVRDGLKPVHRRILYAMKASGNSSSKSYRKSANAVGYVMMHYHPHGDQAIYDSLVRMAQDFSMRYPLVDGQGNFGSIDGDNAAAFRYTEARLSVVGEALLEGIDENAINFQPTYNEQNKEPIVLPAAFPNLLANGATGIAVGMATNIPPHNVGEICDALRYLIKSPQAAISNLLTKMQGPDFPTGGVIVEPQTAILKAYETGRGSIRLRARWEVESLKGGLYQIVITEIPYQVQKAKLIEKIADLLNAKKLPLVGDILDESAADIRLVITPKNRTIDDQALMESLFRQTDLETRFNMNMTVLDYDHTPRVMNLREVLQAFLNHRHAVLLRRSEFRLNQIKDRLEVLQGLQIAYLNLDELIKIIRSEEEPKPIIMKRWNLTDLQAESILNMKLRSLRKLEEYQIKSEIDTLAAQQQDLLDLMQDKQRQWHSIDEEVKKIKKQFGDKRRTTFAEAPVINFQTVEEIVEKEPVTIVCSAKGWIRALKGHLQDFSDIKYKDDDQEKFVLKAMSNEKLILFATNGRAYSVDIFKLPGGRGQGEPIRLIIDLPQDEEIIALFPVDTHRMDIHKKWLLAASDGRGFIITQENMVAQTKSGKQLLNVSAQSKAVACIQAEGDSVAIIGTNRKFLIFKLDEIPSLTKGRGVILQKYKNTELADIKVFHLAEGLKWNTGSRVRHMEDMRLWQGKRGQIGKVPPVGFPRTNKFEG